MGEHDRALGRDRLAEQDAVDAANELRKPVAPLLERAQADDPRRRGQEVEGDEAACAPPALVRSAAKSLWPSGTEHDRLAVDQGVVGGQACAPPPRSSATCR